MQDLTYGTMIFLEPVAPQNTCKTKELIPPITQVKYLLIMNILIKRKY